MRVPDLLISIAGKILRSELPVKVDLHVAGTFELFVDHVVHPGTGVDEARTQYGQAPPSSMLRAAPKNFLELLNAAVHTSG